MIALARNIEIENPRRYDSAAVEELRRLLLQNSKAIRDPRRPTCYEIEGPEATFYVHVSPVSGNVWLIARWTRQPVACPGDAAYFAAP